MVGGVLAAVLSLLIGVAGDLAVWIGVGGGVLVFVAIVLFTTGAITRHQYDLTVMFPAALKAEEPGKPR